MKKNTMSAMSTGTPANEIEELTDTYGGRLTNRLETYHMNNLFVDVIAIEV